MKRMIWMIVSVAIALSLAGCRTAAPAPSPPAPSESVSASPGVESGPVSPSPEPEKVPDDEPPGLEGMAEDYLSEYFGRGVTVTQLEYAEQFQIYEMSLSAYSLAFEVSGGADMYMPNNSDDAYLFFWVDPLGVTESVADMRELDGQTLEQAAMAVGWRLRDVEYSVRREGYPGYYGIGGFGLGLARGNMGEETDEVIPDWKAYGEGDYYGRVTLDGLEYIYYYNAAMGQTDEYHARYIHSLSTTRADVATYRGAHIGMTRDEISELYPEAYSDPVWSYEGDYLWFGDEYGWGSLLFFYFENETVARIEMVMIID